MSLNLPIQQCDDDAMNRSAHFMTPQRIGKKRYHQLAGISILRRPPDEKRLDGQTINFGL